LRARSYGSSPLGTGTVPGIPCVSFTVLYFSCYRVRTSTGSRVPCVSGSPRCLFTGTP
jgi:hypothetical protein